LERTPEDIKIEEMTHHIMQLEKHIGRVAKQSEALVRASRESAKAVLELGHSMTALGACEGEGTLGDVITLMGVTMDELSSSAGSHAELQATDLEEPLNEYVRLINSVKLAIQQRFDKKQAYLAALTDVEVKQIAHNKVALSPSKEVQSSEKQVS
jgi:hypothetical protein